MSRKHSNMKGSWGLVERETIPLCAYFVFLCVCQTLRTSSNINATRLNIWPPWYVRKLSMQRTFFYIYFSSAKVARLSQTHRDGRRRDRYPSMAWIAVCAAMVHTHKYRFGIRYIHSSLTAAFKYEMYNDKLATWRGFFFYSIRSTIDDAIWAIIDIYNL